MNRLIALTLLVALLSACSASTGPGVSSSQVDNGFQLTALDFPGDTAYFRTSDYGPSITIQARLNGIPTNGVEIVYLDPLQGVNEKYETYDSGRVVIRLNLPSIRAHNDTTFVYEFRGLYDGRSTPTMRKVVVALYGTEAPKQMLLRSINESSVEVKWTRMPSDKYADTVFAVDSNGISQRHVVSSDKSSFTFTGLTLGMRYTMSLHTRGGSTPPVYWSPVVRSGVIRIHAMETANGSEIIGLSFTPDGFRTVTPTEFDSADIILAEGSINFGLKPGATLMMTTVIPYIFRGYVGRGHQVAMLPLHAGRMEDRFFSPDSTAYMFTQATTYGVFVDTSSSQPLSAVGYQSFGSTRFFMLQVDPQPNGALVGRDAEGKFIDLEVMSQPLPILALRTSAKHEAQ